MQDNYILIVEDNDIDRTMLREILMENYEILEASNGEEAIEILKSNQNLIKLILLDIFMPVMDGYAFLDLVKADEDLSKIPVIVMTQGDSEEDEIAALGHGATDYIPKPYRSRVIMHRVASLIRLCETTSIMNQFQYDSLTGLFTKEFFYRKVREILDDNPDKEYTILCTNLENFKLYNDTYGREAGDKLLVETARILRGRVSEKAICCRYNADRFLCLTESETERIGRERFVNARKSTRSELAENISVKLGVYEIVNRSFPVEQMCDRALWVVETIKGIYDQHLAIYDDALRNQLLQEQTITDTMEFALNEKQFVVYFQPKYNLHDGSIVGAEALVRWIHPEWGFISPGEFIPLFEKNGFISRLDEYVWDCTCKKLCEWKEKGYNLVPVSVNVSRADVYRAHLVEHFCSLVKKYHIDPSLLHLEITESAYTENTEQIINTVEELRRRGFVVEMDDFGSGYSSLNMLGRMAIDILKLDMGFIRSELAKPIEQSILNDVVNMAHRLHLSVIAEGVETGEQRSRLQNLGCDYAQGYFYAKPLSEAEYEKLLEDDTKKQEKPAGCHITSGENQKKSVSGAKKTVLIVEDDDLNRELLMEIVEEHYIVLTAKNGEEGLEILKRNSTYISAVLLDIQMPVMNGYEFLKQIGLDSELSKIPVIVTSALSCEQEEEKCMRLGAADFIEKPFNARKILMRIGNLTHLKEYGSMVSVMGIDSLTGFKNRKTYYEDIAQIEGDPKKREKPIGIIFADINGLKYTNDSEGHLAGDRLIMQVADTMRKVFCDADIYRLGGDEFVLFSFDDNEETFSGKMKALEKAWQEGQSAALGSVWLNKAVDLEQNVSLADQLMYRNKRLYYEKKNHKRSSQDNMPEDLLKKVDEVSEYLPGGFFMYKADEQEEIISYNTEILKLFGCENKEEFMTLTGNTFKGMVHPEDLERVQKAIREQIEKENDIDYVKYRIICKDGVVKEVWDYGRFVHTQLYGDIYYVFIKDITNKG